MKKKEIERQKKKGKVGGSMGKHNFWGGGRRDPRKEPMKKLLLSSGLLRNKKGGQGFASATGNNVVYSEKGQN
jgi:hypothetical protein